MDVDDLFGAFDGEEKVNDVQAAEPCGDDGKRKAVSEKGPVGQPVAKRQALPADAGGKRERDPNPVMATGKDGGVELKEGEESSTLREDGTFVKSVRTTRAGMRATCRGSRYHTPTIRSVLSPCSFALLNAASSPPSLAPLFRVASLDS